MYRCVRVSILSTFLLYFDWIWAFSRKCSIFCFSFFLFNSWVKPPVLLLLLPGTKVLFSLTSTFSQYLNNFGISIYFHGNTIWRKSCINTCTMVIKKIKFNAERYYWNRQIYVSIRSAYWNLSNLLGFQLSYGRMLNLLLYCSGLCCKYLYINWNMSNPNIE